MLMSRCLTRLSALQQPGCVNHCAVEGSTGGIGLLSCDLSRGLCHVISSRLLYTQPDPQETGSSAGLTSEERLPAADLSGTALDTKRLAPLADGSATASSGGTTVLATIVAEQLQQPLWKMRIHRPFLEVDYQERFSATGRIPHNAQRRELAPSSREVGIAQSVQAALEPLFAKGFAARCQVSGTLISSNGESDPEPLAINAASAAISASSIPWQGPLGAVRVAKLGSGEWVFNPSVRQQKGAALSLLYAGTRDACTRLELQGRNAAAEDVASALDQAAERVAALLEQQQRQGAASPPAKRDMPSILPDPAALHNITRYGRELVESIYQDTSLSHAERTAALQRGRGALEATLRAKGMFRLEHMRVPNSGTASPRDIDLGWEQLQAAALQTLVLERNARPDGRGLSDLRELRCEVGCLPVVHGSALVSPGSSQVLSVATVGNDQDSLNIETALGQEMSSFIAHFSCPAFAINEMKARHGEVKRIEVEGGRLLQMALSSVVPRGRKFPFAVRLTTDVLADDGSAAMTAVSSASLALTNAGVQLSAPVAGVTVGLIVREGEGKVSEWELVTDPGSLEEGLGHMQLHAAGTTHGLTALQLACNGSGGVPLDIVRAAVAKAAQGLPAQLKALEAAMHQATQTGPVCGSLEVGKDNLRRIIGPQGSVIRGLEADSASRLSIDDTGLVHIYSPGQDNYQTAVSLIEGITGAAIKEGSVYKVRVVKLMDYGAFVELPNGFQALLHISELEHERVKSVEDVLAEGDELDVMCLGRDSRGHVKVSRRALLGRPGEDRQDRQRRVLPMMGIAARS
ncbi:hypothetical protein CVIRNUC_007399 [Coccomyxa viridis]|uniref:polyribonucleotide nucleotidyltransferase n=1 Tax=Coccomyxa viridis TaxID=1274662 RepID=A0AAV1ICH1_9CHLO|nr:hypothetical protein CVIRNUC_007399 [Coccomyxa viridis]